MSITSTEVVNALIDDRNPASGWMTQGGRIIEPRSEIWLADAQLWVRSDGMRASCWRGNAYFAESFGWLARLRIRQAVRWWAKRQSSDRTALTDDREDGQDGQRKPTYSPLQDEVTKP